MKELNKLILLITVLFFIALGSIAEAIVINIDPGSYTGRYNAAGLGFVTGSSSPDLAPGAYTVEIAPSNSFRFNVGADGQVTSQNSAAASGGLKKLTFNPITITIDPESYTGFYGVHNVTGTSASLNGIQPVTLLPGVNGYILSIAPSNSFRFNVGADGLVTSQNSAAASGMLKKLTFNTTTVTIDPGSYTGLYGVHNVTGKSANLSGIQPVTLLPGVNGYILSIAPSNSFRFNVGADGLVTSQNSAAASGMLKKLTFNTTTVTIDPGSYTGLYGVHNVTGKSANLSGIQPVTLLPGVNGYILSIAPSNSFRFNVGADGQVTSQNSAAASGGLKKLTFNTTTITIDPESYTGFYGVHNVTGTSASLNGIQPVTLLPGVNGYILSIAPSNSFRFNVGADGLVTTSNSAAASGMLKKLTFNTTTITIDPGSYTGLYGVHNVTGKNASLSGIQSVTLLPGVNGYILSIAPNNSFRFNVSDPCAVDPSQFVLGEFTFNAICQSPVPILSCIGFQSPMDSGPVTVKKNRVLPFKAVVKDDSGNPITDSDIVSPPVIQLSFDAGIGPAVDVTGGSLPAGAGTEGNEFEFDTDKWQYNLKTKNYTALGTYVVTMKSGDDKVYVIDPTCTGTFIIQ